MARKLLDLVDFLIRFINKYFRLRFGLMNAVNTYLRLKILIIYNLICICKQKYSKPEFKTSFPAQNNLLNMFVCESKLFGIQNYFDFVLLKIYQNPIIVKTIRS